ncbi:hypothetical protein, partial [uncultured Mucilaginibacter sp.]|uniref:hypothetical protein n=1 Tax=uncultured Mucilaginibacter sp. TaxID=797541 RepID=UPI0025F746C0
QVVQVVIGLWQRAPLFVVRRTVSANPGTRLKIFNFWAKLSLMSFLKIRDRNMDRAFDTCLTLAGNKHQPC